MRNVITVFVAFALGACVALPAVDGSGISPNGGGGGTTYTGTANQVVVTGSVLSTPQDIATSSKPQFLGLGVGGAAGASDTIKLYGSTSGSSLIQAAAVTTQSVTYTLPAGASNAGDFWTTDASGNILPRTLQAGSGITITRSGTTVTLASTGGGGGGSTSGVTGWPNALWSTGGTFSYTAADITFQADSDSYIVTPNSGSRSIHTAAANLYWGLHTSGDTINRDLWLAKEVSATGGGFEFSPVTDATGSLGWNAGWLNSVIYRMGIPEATPDASGFGASYAVLCTDSATHKLVVSEAGGSFVPVVTALDPTTSLVSIGDALDNNAGSNLPQFKFGTTANANDGDPTMVGPSNDKFTICSAAGKEIQICTGTTFATTYMDFRTSAEGVRLYNGGLVLETALAQNFTAGALVLNQCATGAPTGAAPEGTLVESGDSHIYARLASTWVLVK